MTVAVRTGHFMPASLVDAQFADLEPLREEEAGLTVDGALPPEQILATTIGALAPPGDCAPTPAQSSSPVPGTCSS